MSKRRTKADMQSEIDDLKSHLRDWRKSHDEAVKNLGRAERLANALAHDLEGALKYIDVRREIIEGMMNIGRRRVTDEILGSKLVTLDECEVLIINIIAAHNGRVRGDDEESEVADDRD